MSTEQPWGRVDAEGTVYVRTRDGERVVGQWPGGDPEEAMALYTRRYEGLVVQVELLERRVNAGTLSPDQATQDVAKERTAIAEAQAVGDLDALLARLDALGPVIALQRERRREAKAARQEEARTSKEAIAAEAEKIAKSTDWRRGADRMRALLDEWKALPRLDKASDDALWHRFSAARTTFTRHRRQHFAELNEKREESQVVKEQLVKEAEALSDSTEWGPTSGAYRDLMRRWKAAGPAPRKVEDSLWSRFRAAQDTFFSARDAHNAKLDAEFTANAEVKREILAQAEKLLPITDVEAARTAYLPLAERWEAAGKVPRDQMRELENRMHAVEDAIKTAADDRWRRSNPEARARAADTVAQLEGSLDQLRAEREAAQSSGDEKAVAAADAAIEAREAWLVEARKALTDFTPS